MSDFEFANKINEMINRVKTRQTMFRTIYLTRGCGKTLYRKKLLDYIMQSIQEDVKHENKKIEIRWVKYYDRKTSN